MQKFRDLRDKHTRILNKHAFFSIRTPGYGIHTPGFVLEVDRHTEKDAILAGNFPDLRDKHTHIQQINTPASGMKIPGFVPEGEGCPQICLRMTRLRQPTLFVPTISEIFKMIHRNAPDFL